MGLMRLVLAGLRAGMGGCWTGNRFEDNILEAQMGRFYPDPIDLVLIILVGKKVYILFKYKEE